MKIQYPHTVEELAANPWEEIAESRYHAMLGAVPPLRWHGQAFALGELLCSLDDGREVASMFVQVGGRFWTRPDVLADFDERRYMAEILRQVSGCVGHNANEK